MPSAEFDTPFVTRLSAYRDVSEEGLAALASADGEVFTIPAGRAVWEAGDQPEHIFVLDKGWACHCRALSTGNQQICQILLPGDLMDGIAVLPGGCATTSVQALTELSVRRFDPAKLVAVLKEFDDLAAAVWWSAVQNENILREHITRTAHHTAAEAIAHLMLELNVRYNMAMGSDEDDIPLPLTQTLIADYLGLTPVHVSRTLSLLRRTDYLDLADRRLKILRRRELAEFCGFEPVYLFNGCASPDWSAPGRA